MYLHVRILEFGQQARVSGRDSEPDRGGFFAQLAHSGYATVISFRQGSDLSESTTVVSGLK